MQPKILVWFPVSSETLFSSWLYLTLECFWNFQKRGQPLRVHCMYPNFKAILPWRSFSSIWFCSWNFQDVSLRFLFWRFHFLEAFLGNFQAICSHFKISRIFGYMGSTRTVPLASYCILNNPALCKTRNRLLKRHVFLSLTVSFNEEKVKSKQPQL